MYFEFYILYFVFCFFNLYRANKFKMIGRLRHISNNGGIITKLLLNSALIIVPECDKSCGSTICEVEIS